MVKQISFKNYKLFKKKQTLELRPITILIGKNNSGKSAITKLPTMIASSLTGKSSAPLNWVNKISDDSNDTIELGASFEDLVYNRQSIGNIEIGISNFLNDIDSQSTKNLQTLEVIVAKSEILEYRLNGIEKDVSTTKFKGFLPKGKKIEGLSLNIDYIGAFRAIPKSNYSSDNEEFSKIGIDGRNAYQTLIQDFFYDNLLIPKISQWYENNFETWKIEVLKIDAKTEIIYQVTISNKDIVPINITNVGQGIHQVLPLIVRSYIIDEEPVLIIIEEPETHLHPAIHGNLAERFVNSFQEDSNKNYLIETHSQNFVLRMRRLVAEGKLSKDDLAIYYVDFDEQKQESSLKLIEVDGLGRVSFWPEGIFNETLTETIGIRTAQTSSKQHGN
jgi:predicted ATPase